MILEMTRGHIKLKVGDRTVTIYGEALLPSPGEPDFVCGRASIKTWDPPHEKDALTEGARKQIIEMVRSELAKRKMTLEVD
jgi:hypothetical protein